MVQETSPSFVSADGLVIRTGHFLETPTYRTIRPRGSPDWLLVHTLSGYGRFAAPGGDLAATPGTLTLSEPGVYHDYGTGIGAPHWELLWIHFHPRLHWVELLNWPRASEGLMQIHIGDSPQRDALIAAFWNVHRIALGGRPRRELFAMAALEELLLWCDLVNPASSAPALDIRISTAIEYICTNLALDLNVERIAEQVFTSPSRFAHLFKQQTGQSVQQFVEVQRIERAKQLLAATGRPIQSIASDIGYASPFYFSLRFKKCTGDSPSQYREKIIAGV